MVAMGEPKEYPALRRRLAIVQVELSNYTAAADRDKWNSSPDLTILARLAEIRAEYTELDDLLRHLEHPDESKIGVKVTSVATQIIINSVFLALILYLLFAQH
jgi:hypothetical protein